MNSSEEECNLDNEEDAYNVDNEINNLRDKNKHFSK